VPDSRKQLVTMLIDAGCEVSGATAGSTPRCRVKPATDDTWTPNMRDAIITEPRKSSTASTSVRADSHHGRTTPMLFVKEDAAVRRPQISQRVDSRRAA